MSLEKHKINSIPVWTWLAPAVGCLLLAAMFASLVPASNTPVYIIAAGLLGAAVFASVHHAEIIALRVGEPYGSIILAIAVTVIEVALIISIMASAKGGSDVLARDTVFATVMIVLNGIVGLCIMIGGARHHTQSFETNAAAAALSVLGTLAVITMILPNYTRTTPGPVYAPSQLIFVSVFCILLYFVFLFVQTIRHRDYFLVETDAAAAELDDGTRDEASVPTAQTAFISLALLVLSLAVVVLLAKTLSPWLEKTVSDANLPKSFVGVVIAAIVLLPEGLAAVTAARLNRLQTSLNLALGSAMATIGLTVPIVGGVALFNGQPMTLGLGAAEMVLLVLTLFISTVTLATGRTTILQGAVHLVIFAVFMMIAAVP